jgi:hypothetical protein
MHKKLITALAAFVAFAVLPSAAMATNSPQLQEGGTALATGSKIVATSVGSPEFTSTSRGMFVVCTTGKLAGTLTSNSPGESKAKSRHSTFMARASPAPTTV